jgi:hypothetical protein
MSVPQIFNIDKRWDEVMKKLLVPTVLASVLIVAMSFAVFPVEKASTVHSTILSKTVPEAQWFSLRGITLGDGEFLDLVDTTPALVRDGHVALYVPCNEAGESAIQLLQGRVGETINTLAPVELEFIASLSDPGNNCLYHVDIGTSGGETDFAIINDSGDPITFGDRNTIAFTIVEIV